MHRVIATLVVLIALAGCSSGGGGSASRSAFVVSGHVVLAGRTGEHAVLQVTHDDTCYGVGRNTAFQVSTPLTIQSGSDMFTTVLGPGALVTTHGGTVITGCRFPFAIADVPSRSYDYTVKIAGVQRAFTRAQLGAPITVRVAGRPVD